MINTVQSRGHLPFGVPSFQILSIVEKKIELFTNSSSRPDLRFPAPLGQALIETAALPVMQGAHEILTRPLYKRRIVETCGNHYCVSPVLSVQLSLGAQVLVFSKQAIDDPSSNQFRDPPTYTHQPSMQQKVPFSLIRCSSSKVAFCSCVE